MTDIRDSLNRQLCLDDSLSASLKLFMELHCSPRPPAQTSFRGARQLSEGSP